MDIVNETLKEMDLDRREKAVQERENKLQQQHIDRQKQDGEDSLRESIRKAIRGER